ncbi:helix-turn-helix domain-containing protein [Roseisolibacter agri]|uniref:helix-turn-helix domain-containing protein n=1 Tax=Roseisolibacter agri TaxID=2014610 RepID=UPI0024E07104|nr:helix-turn-helix transcriptional regulator [Roseisolibacter agri]
MLAALRRPTGLSQERLAFQAGIDRTFVGQLERGTKWPTLETVWRILHALDVGWDAFGAALAERSELQRRPAPGRGWRAGL